MAALSNIRVICVGQFYLAPYCSMLLARLGADVIKVEAPAGDPYRRLPTKSAMGSPIQFDLVNSGKRGIRLDLKHPDGQALLRRLASTADVLVENLAPGAMDRFGLDYVSMKAVNPRLIYGSGTGFGSFGPYAGEPAMDLTIQARTAIMSTTGFHDGPPLRTGPSVVDFMAGAHLASGVLAALVERTTTGRGQHVEVALQDAILPALASNIAGYLSSGGALPERTGNRHGGLAVVPYNAFSASDGWITLLCPTDGHWQRLCRLMDDPSAYDIRFADMTGRTALVSEVEAIVEAWTSVRTKDELVKVLQAANVPCAPVVTLPEVLVDPHVLQRGVIRRVDDEHGQWWTFGSPLFLSDSPQVTPSRPPALGEHTEAILAQDLSMAVGEIDALRELGVI